MSALSAYNSAVMARKRSPQKRSGLPSQRVEIDFVLLADFAQAVNGKLTVVGAGWNMLTPKTLPVTLPFGLGIGFLVPWSETNRRHNFKFSIARSEGKGLLDGGGDFEIGRQPGIPVGMEQRIVLGLSGQVKIEEPGTYEIVVSCAGRKRRVIFEVQLPAAPPPNAR